MSSTLPSTQGLAYQKAFSHDPGLHSFITTSLNLLPPDASILDIGCGTGKPTSSLIVSSGRSVHGIDLSPTMLALARSQVPQGTFQEINMLDFSVEPGKEFDAAFANFSLFELSRAQTSTAIQKFAQWIKPHGYLFIGTMIAESFSLPNMTYDSDGLVAKGVQHLFLGNMIGNLLFTRKGWEALLRENGFEVVGTEMVPFQPPVEAETEEEPHFYITARRVR